LIGISALSEPKDELVTHVCSRACKGKQFVGLGILPVQIYLYGSHAKGTASEGSDVELFG
jgi:hypothetical protein